MPKNVSDTLEKYAKHSLCIDIVRLYFTLLVVLFHTFQIQICAEDGFYVEWIKKIIDALLSDLLVPVFFFISGHLFFSNFRWRKEFFIGKIKRRGRSLLLPYLIWNTLGIFMVLVKEPSRLVFGGGGYPLVFLDV